MVENYSQTLDTVINYIKTNAASIGVDSSKVMEVSSDTVDLKHKAPFIYVYAEPDRIITENKAIGRMYIYFLCVAESKISSKAATREAMILAGRLSKLISQNDYLLQNDPENRDIEFIDTWSNKAIVQLRYIADFRLFEDLIT